MNTSGVPTAWIRGPPPAKSGLTGKPLGMVPILEGIPPPHSTRLNHRGIFGQRSVCAFFTAPNPTPYSFASYISHTMVHDALYLYGAWLQSRGENALHQFVCHLLRVPVALLQNIRNCFRLLATRVQGEGGYMRVCACWKFNELFHKATRNAQSFSHVHASEPMQW